MAAAPNRQTVRRLLVLGVLAGLVTYVVTPLERPDQLSLASDVYRTAATAILTSGELYGVYPTDRTGYGYLYPPITVLVFVPHALLPTANAAFTLQLVTNLIAAIGTAVVIARALKRRDVPIDRRDVLVLAGFMVLSSYSTIQFINGQINLWLALALAIGFEAVDRNDGRIAGIAFGIAALFKVFPAVIGLWLMRTRALSAIVVASATGIGGLLLGALLFGPELTLTYLVDVLLGRFEGSTYDGRPDPTDNVDGVHRQLAAIWPSGDIAHTVVGLVIVGTLVGMALRRSETTVERDVAALGTIVGGLLFLPLQPLYFPLIVFPLVMLLYTLPTRPERWIIIVGMLLTFLHTDQDSVVLALRLVPLPSGIETIITSATAHLFTFVLPPTLGLWCMLIACALLQVRPKIAPSQFAPATTPGIPATLLTIPWISGRHGTSKRPEMEGNRSETDRRHPLRD